MRNAISYAFRAINSSIIGTRYSLIRKLLKVSIVISNWVRIKFGMKRRGEVQVNNYDGDLKIIIDPSRSMGSAIYWTGFHEIKELAFLHRFLKPDMVFLDVGGNLGEYTLFAAKRLFKGKVFTFEPLPAMIECLARNVNLNALKNITICPYGLSDQENQLEIFEARDVHEGLATLYPVDKRDAERHLIDVKVLDTEFPKLRVDRLDVLKIDIEGGELFALKGAVETIRKFRPLVMIEINEITYKAAGYTTDDVFDFFSAMKYRPFSLDHNVQLIPSKSVPTFANIIFVAE